MVKLEIPEGTRAEIQLFGAPSGYTAISAAETVLAAEIHQDKDTAYLVLCPLAKFHRPIEVEIFSVDGSTLVLEVTLENPNKAGISLGTPQFFNHEIPPRPTVISQVEEPAPAYTNL